jgi:hypothetical protein
MVCCLGSNSCQDPKQLILYSGFMQVAVGFRIQAELRHLSRPGTSYTYDTANQVT